MLKLAYVAYAIDVFCHDVGPDRAPDIEAQRGVYVAAGHLSGELAGELEVLVVFILAHNLDAVRLPDRLPA